MHNRIIHPRQQLATQMTNSQNNSFAFTTVLLACMHAMLCLTSQAQRRLYPTYYCVIPALHTMHHAIPPTLKSHHDANNLDMI
jgi:pyruvate/2-oxoglutarate dehydrogenase complex dihydrolipoamide acyltransferase (E2) component